MALARLDIEIDKGFDWEALLVFPGNRFMSANFKGQMRATSLSTVILATFQFDLPRYRTESNQTEQRVFLPKSGTLTLPATTEALWVYDMRATLVDGTSYLITAGQARVWETVTRADL